MTAAGNTVFPSSSCVASDLVNLLDEGLERGLPEPGLICITSGGRGRWPREISLQFSGPDETGAVRAWADLFGAAVSVHPSGDGTVHRATFTYEGIHALLYAVAEAT